MRKLWTRLGACGICLAWLVSLQCASSQYVKGNVYKTPGINFKDAKFAVLTFESSSQGKTMTNRVSTDGNAIADLLTIQMLFKEYKVAEREKVNQVFQEVALTQSGAADTAGTKQAADIGKILGADYIVYGSVIQYEYELTKGGNWRLAVGITARIIEVKTSNVVLAISASQIGDNLADALDGITLAFVDALSEEKIYVWQ